MNQLINMLLFILTGIVIGVLFDIFRIIRRSFKTPDFLTYIEDILFWLMAGIILLFTIFTFNNGEIRLYIFVSLLFGLTIYLLTLSKFFIKINVKIIGIIKKIVCYPIKLIYNFIKHTSKKTTNNWFTFTSYPTCTYNIISFFFY